MESRDPQLQRSDMEMHGPPRWGFSPFEIAGYNHVASPELKNASSASARAFFETELFRLGRRIVNGTQAIK